MQIVLGPDSTGRRSLNRPIEFPHDPADLPKQPIEGHDYGLTAEGLAGAERGRELRNNFLFQFLPKNFLDTNPPPFASGERRCAHGRLAYHALVSWYPAHGLRGTVRPPRPQIPAAK